MIKTIKGKAKNKFYSIAVIITNSLILFTILNTLSYAAIYYSNKNDLEDTGSDFEVRYVNTAAYTDVTAGITRTKKHIKGLIKDHLKTDKNGFAYFPATEFIEYPYHSDYCNIDTYGIGVPHRASYTDPTKAANEETITILTFGGSTTRGTLVADNDTWPSFMAMLANNITDKKVHVINLGYHAFTPTQETSLFLYLLKLGHRPSAAIFLDGLNTGPLSDVSVMSENMSFIVEKAQTEISYIERFSNSLPLFELISSYIQQDEIDYLTNNNTVEHPLVGANVTQQNINIISQRFIQNYMIRESIGELYNIPLFQYLQPNTLLGYDRDFMTANQLEALDNLPNDDISSAYRQVYDQVLDKSDFDDLSGLFDDFCKPATIDFVHYSPSFNKYLASTILDKIQIDSLVPYQKVQRGGLPYDVGNPPILE